MKVKDIIAPLEEFAPLRLQESYDNSGLLVGDLEMEMTGALLCVDATPEVVREARAKGINLVIAHHPVIFHPLRSLTGRSNVEETVIEAVKGDIALYACHTNLDRAPHGMSYALAEKLGLTDIAVLDPEGEGAGFGAVGNLVEPMPALDFLRQVAHTLDVGCIRHTTPPKESVRRVALVTGAGGEMLEKAIASGADVFLTADLRHDRFLAAEGHILLADIGHWESEFCAIELMHSIISKKITNFALHKSANSLNPVNYLVGR
jgi:dinuclear metal center YbgI/SA1388 family protein